MTADKNSMLHLDALAWKASMLGVSYGKLSETLTQEQTAEIVDEYMEYCREKQKQEQLRSQRAKANKKKRPGNRLQEN